MVDSKEPTTNYQLPTTSPLVVIVGETASGKSALALELAQKFDGEMLCADSRTVYAGLNIGTAKPSAEDRKKVPHHLLDVATPDQNFTVADFKQLATDAIMEIAGRGKLPIMVGGTGLYVDSLLYDYQFSGPGAERDEQNPRHLKQAESFEKKAMRSNTLVIGLHIERAELERRIVLRVEGMCNGGLMTEAEGLVRDFGWEAPGLQTIGYKEFRSVFTGEQSIELAKQQIVQNTKAYAKRQRTWFKRNKSTHWVQVSAQAETLIQNFLSKQPATS